MPKYDPYTCEKKYVEPISIEKVNQLFHNFKPSQWREGLCFFCANTDILCESHVVPSGLYKLVKDGGRNVVEVTKDGGEETSHEGQEKILCSNCEVIFNILFDQRGVNTIKYGILPKTNFNRDFSYVSFNKNVIGSFILSIFIRHIFSSKFTENENSVFLAEKYKDNFIKIFHDSIFGDSSGYNLSLAYSSMPGCSDRRRAMQVIGPILIRDPGYINILQDCPKFPMVCIWLNGIFFTISIRKVPKLKNKTVDGLRKNHIIKRINLVNGDVYKNAFINHMSLLMGR